MAGWGRYPLLVAEALKRQGPQVYCLGVVGHADPKLAEVCDHFQWSGLARFGAAMRYFQRHGVTDAMMAGKIHKVVLFQPWRWLRHVPDLRTHPDVHPPLPHAAQGLQGRHPAGGHRRGVRRRRDPLWPGHRLRAGIVGRRRASSPPPGPSAWQWKDIRFGWQIAKEMGRLDIGQSVAVRDQAVMAVEAVEGTDECIRRAGELCRAGGFTVVKVAKPQQDMRFDVPTVGLQTLETLAGRRRPRVGHRSRPHHPAGRPRGDRFRRSPSPGDRGRGRPARPRERLGSAE